MNSQTKSDRNILRSSYTQVKVTMLCLGEDTLFRKQLEKVLKYNSRIFSFTQEIKIVTLKKPTINSHGKPYYETNYIKDTMDANCKLGTNEICIGITAYKVGDRYGGCLNVLPIDSDSDLQNIFYLSVYKIVDKFSKEHIPLENYFLAAVYRDVLRFLCRKRIAHYQMNECIFDTCEFDETDTDDVMRFSAKPKICGKEEIKIVNYDNAIAKAILNCVKAELKTIRRKIGFILKDWFSEHPLIMGLLSLLGIGMTIYEIIKAILGA